MSWPSRFTVMGVSFRWLQVDAGGREEEEKNKEEDRIDCMSTANPLHCDVRQVKGRSTCTHTLAPVLADIVIVVDSCLLRSYTTIIHAECSSNIKLLAAGSFGISSASCEL